MRTENSLNLERRAATIERATGAYERPEGIHPEGAIERSRRLLVVWPRPNGQPNELLPFGKDLDLNPDQPNPVEAAYKLTFTNKEIDHQTDLHYFGARGITMLIFRGSSRRTGPIRQQPRGLAV